MSGSVSRRTFIGQNVAAIGAGLCGSYFLTPLLQQQALGSMAVAAPRFGLVTYQWGKDMDLPTVIDACQKAGLPGVELRTQHKHAVEPELSQSARQDVKKRFADSGV
ncbi:MAG: sugar phosphate isomerase/epimerase, partial [Phycisphaerae bacterium]